jgi:hypothetical protein
MIAKGRTPALTVSYGGTRYAAALSLPAALPWLSLATGDGNGDDSSGGDARSARNVRSLRYRRI